MRCIKTALLLGILMFAASCAQIQVTHDYDKDANFSLFKTYSWHSLERTIAMNDLVINRVKNAVNRELQLRGYEQVQENPDFSIAIQVFEREKLSFSDWGYPSGPYWGPYGYPYGGWYDRRRLSAREYQEGTLIIDVLDMASEELVWRGTATDIIDPSMTPEERTTEINKAVLLILQKFPPFP